MTNNSNEITFSRLGAVPLSRLEQDVEYTTSRAEECVRNIATQEWSLGVASEQRATGNADEFFAKIKDSLPDFLRTGVYETICRGVDANVSRVSHLERAITNSKNSYSSLISDLTRRKQKLEEAKRSDGIITLTKDQLREIMARIPNVKRSTPRLGEDNNGVFISWVFEGLLMRPDINPYANINNGGPVAIAIPNCLVKIHPSSAKIRITTSGKNRRGIDNSFGSNKPNPHILSGGKPCLGGFESNFILACEQADIQLMALTLREFLSQANNADGAGRHWPQFISPIRRVTEIEGERIVPKTGYDIEHETISSDGELANELFGLDYIYIDARKYYHLDPAGRPGGDASTIISMKVVTLNGSYFYDITPETMLTILAKDDPAYDKLSRYVGMPLAPANANYW